MLFPWTGLQLLIILNSSMCDCPPLHLFPNSHSVAPPNGSGIATTTVAPSKDAEPHSLNSPRFG